MGLLDNIDEEESLSNELDDDEYVGPDYEHRLLDRLHQRIELNRITNTGCWIFTPTNN